MTGVLFIGSKGPATEIYNEYVRDVNFVIAADSGLELAVRIGIVPDLVVGDMDSIANRSLLGNFDREKIRIFPTDKDETDTEIGLRIFQEMGYNDIIIVGGGKGRLDHLLGIVALFERPFAPSMWITDGEVVFLITDTFHVRGWKGATISLFPIGKEVGGMESLGLKWTINGLSWKRGYYGISNIVTNNELYISVKKGKLLLVKNLAGV